MKTAKEVKQAICDAVWTREIDQMNTREVAEQFDCSLVTARRILMSIYEGTSGDSRFQKSEDRGYGVLVHDGATFGFSEMSMDGSYGVRKGEPTHYVWFAS